MDNSKKLKLGDIKKKKHTKKHKYHPLTAVWSSEVTARHTKISNWSLLEPNTKLIVLWTPVDLREGARAQTFEEDLTAIEAIKALLLSADCFVTSADNLFIFRQQEKHYWI